jgi:hypothetical protein
MFNRSKKLRITLGVVTVFTILLAGTMAAFAVAPDSGMEPVIAEATGLNGVIFSDTSISENGAGFAAQSDASIIIEGENAYDGYVPVEPFANGDLAAGKSYSYDYQSLSKGQTVTINADWTPTGSNVNIGLKSSNGTVTSKTVTGGSGEVTYTINSTGYYYIYIGNPSSAGVKFTVSYIVN